MLALLVCTAFLIHLVADVVLQKRIKKNGQINLKSFAYIFLYLVEAVVVEVVGFVVGEGPFVLASDEAFGLSFSATVTATSTTHIKNAIFISSLLTALDEYNSETEYFSMHSACLYVIFASVISLVFRANLGNNLLAV